MFSFFKSNPQDLFFGNYQKPELLEKVKFYRDATYYFILK